MKTLGHQIKINCLPKCSCNETQHRANCSRSGKDISNSKIVTGENRLTLSITSPGFHASAGQVF